MFPPVFTIGHSTHTLARLLALLEQHGVTAAADVRSLPYSRMNPQFDREPLRDALRKAGLAYVYLGKELGARREEAACYDGNRVDYERVADSSLFLHGLDRVQDGCAHFRIALLCAEKEPLDCHRTQLVSRRLEERGVPVIHIHADGGLETHAEALERLLDKLGLLREDIFRTREEIAAEAYRRQGRRMAYTKMV